MTTYLERWLDDPDGGGCFLRQAELIRQHNPECPSLDDVWLPKRNGYSDLLETMECEVCQLTFFWSGLSENHTGCPDSYHWTCQCCTQSSCRCALTSAGTEASK